MSEQVMNPVVWFEIYVQDMARARAFYETVLGVELSRIGQIDDESSFEMWAFPMREGAEGSAGALAHVHDMPSGGNSTLVYFNCEDCAVEASRVEAAGGTLLRDKISIGEHGFVAHARDTEGNMVGFHSMS